MKGDKSFPDSTKVKASRHKEKEEEDTGGVVRDITLVGGSEGHEIDCYENYGMLSLVLLVKLG
jgi:hypothetical protein